MLVFDVKGSAKSPYKITARGSGADLEIRCSCPAGSRGGQFCKHVAALLSGDVTRVVSGADQADELLHRAEGSPLLIRAMSRHEQPDTTKLASIGDVEQRYRSELEAAGWGVQRSEETKPWKSEALTLHDFFKNGKMKKVPSHELVFEAETAESVWHEDGSITYENRRPSARPWRVRSKALSRPKSFVRLDAACQEFLRLLDLS